MTVPNFLEVFEGRIKNLLKHIKAEYDKPKKDRSRAKLKKFIGEARAMRAAVQEAKQEHTPKCPHCGKKL